MTYKHCIQFTSYWKKGEESCHKLFQLNYPCMRKHGIENFTFSDVK